MAQIKIQNFDDHFFINGTYYPKDNYSLSHSRDTFSINHITRGIVVSGKLEDFIDGDNQKFNNSGDLIEFINKCLFEYDAD